MDKPRKAFTSAKQVAELAGVSRSAVSRTFTPGASVSEETRQRVISAADKLGYHVNHLARGLLRQSSGIVCLVASDADAPYMSHLIRLLVCAFQGAGKVAMVLETSGSGQNADHALRQTLNYRADATVVLSGTPPQSLIHTCIENGQRLILINRDDQLAGPYNISLDNRGAARIACETLLAAGCERLALVNSQAGTPSLMAREQAFVECARQRGVQVAVTRNSPTSYQSGLLGARDLLGAVRDGERPDGVFCVTDLIACGFLDGARQEHGLAIPADLSVIGFDDIEQAGWTSYQLTTFSPDLAALVTRVVTLATMAVEKDTPANRELIDVPLVRRATVREA